MLIFLFTQLTFTTHYMLNVKGSQDPKACSEEDPFPRGLMAHELDS